MKYFLIVRQQNNQLGDLLCSVPMYLAIKEKFPDSYITLITAPTNYDIPFKELNPYLDKLIIFKKNTFKEYLDFIKEIRKIKYDFGINPSTLKISKTSNIINFLSRAKTRVGVKSIDDEANKLYFLLDIKSEYNWNSDKIHQIYRMLDVVNQIGCVLPQKDIDNLIISLNKEESYFAQEFIKNNFSGNKPIFAFHPGAGKTDNRWATKNFIELIELLKNKYNNHVLITSGSIDTEVTKEVTNGLKLRKINSLVLENYPVKKLAAILKLIDLYITNDTGVMHLAGFVGTKIISLFGPTKGYEWAPIKSNQIYIQSRSNNINDIEVKDVFDKTIELYGRAK